MEEIKTNHLNSTNVGRTSARVRKNDATFDNAEMVVYEEYLQSFWPDYNPVTAKYSHEQEQLRSRNFRIIDSPVQKAQPIVLSDCERLTNYQLRSRWDEMMVVARQLVTTNELQELINDQEERERELI
jgi:hypothetical protein|tara:strand:- start:78 stop:461 length:384 start_codon:yes stop_codon:yes gene_type:complete